MISESREFYIRRKFLEAGINLTKIFRSDWEPDGERELLTYYQPTLLAAAIKMKMPKPKARRVQKFVYVAGLELDGIHRMTIKIPDTYASPTHIVSRPGLLYSSMEERLVELPPDKRLEFIWEAILKEFLKLNGKIEKTKTKLLQEVRNENPPSKE